MTEDVPPAQIDNTAERADSISLTNNQEDNITMQSTDKRSTERNIPPPIETQKQGQNDDDDDDDGDGDDESDFDELDEVLDDFSKPKPSEPSRPEPEDPQQSSSSEIVDEDIFMKQLEQEMADIMNHAAKGGSGASGNEAFETAISRGADALAEELESSGVPPADFLKQLLAEAMNESGRDTKTAAGDADVQVSSSGSGDRTAPESFNDAIQRTVNRMKESGDKATAAVADDSDDLVAQLMKALEMGAAGAADDGDLTKMFMGMMEQLSNKDMLYLPMKELDGKFGPWIAENRGKIPDEDIAQHETQARIVSQIVSKFEEPGYSDKDEACRSYIWDKMQEMQASGNPPDELISNPLMEELQGSGAGKGIPDCPQQ